MKYKTIVAMAIIGGLEAYALYLGVDGQVLSLVIGILSGLGGYEYAKEKAKA